MSSEKKIICGSENLIVCFGGMALKFGGFLPFEFLNYLSAEYKGSADLIFYTDKHQSWYQNGIEGISNNVDETVTHLNQVIKKGNYRRVIFMGTSAGGYAAILFGSLCGVNNVIGFKPRTRPGPDKIGIKGQVKYNIADKRYEDLKNVINKTTSYTLYGDMSVESMEDNHHIFQCDNLKEFENVNIVRMQYIAMKELRDNGTIREALNRALSVR